MDVSVKSASIDSNSNLYGEKVEAPGGPEDPNMKDEVDPELNPANSIVLKDPQQQYLYAVETIRQLRARLIRRTNVIDEIRKFYLRDIVTMRHILREVLTEPEREAVWREYEAALPSIDLSQMLKLHAPSKGEFRIRPCEKCGGQLEIVSRDTDEVEALKKVISDSKDRENRWREKLATLDAQIEATTLKKAEDGKAHMEEKRVLYAEMKKLREVTEKSKNEAQQYAHMHKMIKEDYENFKRKNADLFEAQRKVELLEQELYSAKINIEEKEESIKNFKTQERTLAKELQLTKESVDELSKERDLLEDEIYAAKQESQSLLRTLSTINIQLQENESKLEQVQAENKEVVAKLEVTQNEFYDMRVAHTTAMESTARELDSLKFELKELTITCNQADNELETNKKELSEAMAKIDELTELNKQLEMELLDSADEIELFEEEIAAMQQFIREKISQTDGDSDEDDLMREFEEQFRGKLDDEEDEDDELEEDEEETEKAGDPDETKTKAEGGDPESPKRMKKQKSSLKRQKSSRGKLTKARSRVLSAKEYENPDLDQMKQDEQNEGGEDKNEAGKTPTDYRDRRRAIAVSRNNSVRRVGSFRGQTNTNSPTASGSIPQATTVATLRKQMRSGSVMVSPTNKALTTITSNDEGSLKDYDDFDDNSSIEIDEAPNATTIDESPGDILAEVSRRKTKSRTRKSTGMTLTSGRNSKRISNARKRRSVAADNTRYGDDDEPSLPKLIDPEILMKLNQRENLFGVPNEKVTLQRMESLRRRRSIPRDFVYYELKKAPVAIEENATEIVTATGDGTVTIANTEIVPALPPLDKKAQRRLDRNFTLYTREILTNTKGRIENIKSMLQETPPTTARSLRSAGGGGGGVGEKRRRKAKRNDAVIEDSDLDQEEEEREQPTEEVKNRKSSNAYLSKKPPSANGKKDAARTTKVGIPQVELTPPPENAGKFELALRQGLLTVIRNTKGMNENFTHTVVNGITPFIHTVATEVTDLFNSLWQSVYANKTSLDFFEKLSTVFQGIMSLMTPDATTVQLADVCAQVVPLAGSTLNASVTQQWQEAVQIDEEVLLSLLPTVVNYGTGERRNKSLNEFMEDKIHIYPYNPKIATAIDKTDPNNPNLNSEGIDETIYQYFPKFQQLKSSIQKMHDQTQFMNTTLSEYFIEVLRDWSSAKTVFLELDKRLENEREKARKPLDMKLLTISKELNKMTALYEKNMELMRNLEIKLKEYEKYEAELKKCELKLIDTQAQLEVLMTEHSDLSKEHQLLVEKKEKLSKEIESYEELVEKLYKEIADHKSEISQLKDKIRSLEGSLQVMTDDRDEVQAKYDHMLDLEDRRLNRTFPVAIQTEPLVHDIGLQTEFFIPPMDLKTVVVNKLSRSGLKKYPLVFSQSLEYLPDLRHDNTNGPSQRQQNQNHHKLHVFPSDGTSVSSSVASVSIADELRHPLAIGLNPNYTNTNTLIAKLKTNDALANKSALLNSSSSMISQALNQPINSSRGVMNTTSSTQTMPPKHSFLRSDSATSTDSLQFNFTEFKAQPPLIRYHYNNNSSNSSQNPHGGNNVVQNYPGTYLEHSIFEEGDENGSSSSQPHYYQNSPMLLADDQEEERENQQFSEYGNRILDTYAQTTANTSYNDLLSGDEDGNNDNELGASGFSQKGVGGERVHFLSQEKPHGPPSHQHSMPKLFKASSFHPPNQGQNPPNNLNQSSILTISTIHPMYSNNPSQSSASPQKQPNDAVSFESSIESQTTTATQKLVGPSLRKSNQHQDIIDGIIYNHRANDHYSNVLYKTNTMNDALAVNRTYDQYYHAVEEGMDSLSITSLTQANARDKQEKDKAVNRIAKNSLNQSLPAGLRPPSINTGASPSRGNTNGGFNSGNNSAAMSASMKKKLFFPDIGGSSMTGTAHSTQGMTGGNRSSKGENTIKRLQKELF